MWHLLFLLAVAETARHAALPPFMLGRPSKGFLNDGFRHFTGKFAESSKDDSSSLQRLNFMQKVDHFNISNKNYFQQRYWYNSAFTKKINVIFLMIQGESIATDQWASFPNYTYLIMAEQNKADVFQLEHRCFGYSRPYLDLTTEHLGVCTMRQALADISSFIKAMNVKYGFTNPKWVTFGGSYSGTLNALFRANFPDLTVGAIASSAPLNLKLDFYEYAQVVEDSLRSTDPICAAAVEKAFSTIQTLTLTNNGRRLLNTYFNLQPPFEDDNVTQLDIENLFANLYAVFQGVTQYTYDGRNDATIHGLGINNLCKRMTSEKYGDVLIRLNNTINWVNSYYGGPIPFPNSYSAMIKVLQNTTYDDEDPDQDNAANRGWMWLCCNELGFLQTTDQGRNIFQQTVPLNYYIDMCTDMFGPEINIKYVQKKNLAAQQRWKGASGYQATNIVLPNGSYDPWHALGTFNANNKTHMTPILIQGAGHCSDMYPIYKGEPEAISNARLKIQTEMRHFLGMD